MGVVRLSETEATEAEALLALALDGADGDVFAAARDLAKALAVTRRQASAGFQALGRDRGGG